MAVTAQLVMQDVDRITGDCLYLDETDWVDIEDVLDMFEDDMLPEEIETDYQFKDDVFYKAAEEGFLPEHDGPFELNVDEDEYCEYRERRLGL